jgi:hypothetical protein
MTNTWKKIGIRWPGEFSPDMGGHDDACKGEACTCGVFARSLALCTAGRVARQTRKQLLSMPITHPKKRRPHEVETEILETAVLAAVEAVLGAMVAEPAEAQQEFTVAQPIADIGREIAIEFADGRKASVPVDPNDDAEAVTNKLHAEVARMFADEPPSPTPRHMSLDEFQQLGYLQEANRLFFHPRGLALEMVVERDGSMRLGGIWDYRDDPEGIVFADPPCPEKAIAVGREYMRHEGSRTALLGHPIQNAPGSCGLKYCDGESTGRIRDGRMMSCNACDGEEEL